MNQELALTWTPILKQLPDEERERARELIEKYGETNPSNFIVELLAIFGVHAVYLQTIPTQVRIAGERAKTDVQQSIDAVTGLHERTRLELNELVSAVSRQGVAFKRALEAATAAQVKAAADSGTEIQDTIQSEFAKQNLPAITNALKEIESKAGESLRQAQRNHESAKTFEEYAQERLASSEKRSRESLEKVEKINWRGAWATCISFSLAFLTIALFYIDRQLRSRSDDILAEKIARTASLIQDNKDAFMELSAAGLRIKFLEATPPQPDSGSPLQIFAGGAVVVKAPPSKIEQRGEVTAGRDDDKVPVVEDGDAARHVFDANVAWRIDGDELAALRYTHDSFPTAASHGLVSGFQNEGIIWR